MGAKTITSPNAPAPIGPYSQAIHATGEFIFTSGQIALIPETNELLDAGIAQQTRQVIQNLEAVLTAAGSGLSKVIKTTVFLKNMDDFSQMNAEYASFFGTTKPARSTVEVSRLPKDVLVEIDCIALK